MPGCTPPAVTTGPALQTGISNVQEFNPVPSIINVPVEIRTHALEQMINEQLPPLLFESDTITLGDVRLTDRALQAVVPAKGSLFLNVRE